MDTMTDLRWTAMPAAIVLDSVQVIGVELELTVCSSDDVFSANFASPLLLLMALPFIFRVVVFVVVLLVASMVVVLRPTSVAITVFRLMVPSISAFQIKIIVESICVIN
jgi:hypothetical protein